MEGGTEQGGGQEVPLGQVREAAEPELRDSSGHWAQGDHIGGGGRCMGRVRRGSRWQACISFCRRQGAPAIVG